MATGMHALMRMARSGEDASTHATTIKIAKINA